ncbi:MAG TPA: ABC transporter permease [Acidimicrobiales bacterium]|nr:ABC transporter permease [Acidimicrobiales bacterium]
MTELLRRPGRFVLAGVVLTLISLLLMLLGGLLDGLIASSTGAYRAQPGDLISYSSRSENSLVRSRITASDRSVVSQTPGVQAVGGLGSIQLGARPGDDPKSRDPFATVLFGYELAPRGLPATPPAQGSVYADDVLAGDGVAVGDTLLLGPQRSPVKVRGFVTDTRYAGQASLWGSLATWRAVTTENRPGQTPGDTVQALIVETGASPPATVAQTIDEATDGRTTTLTVTRATQELPGVAQQTATFNQIIGVTVLVALVVVALFFALITVERTAQYGLLKAIGASGFTLFGGLIAQAIAVTLVAAAIGVGAAVVFAAVLPPGAIPFQATPARLAGNVGLMLLASVFGCAFSLRRVLRIDPASAIGS